MRVSYMACQFITTGECSSTDPTFKVWHLPTIKRYDFNYFISFLLAWNLGWDPLGSKARYIWTLRRWNEKMTSLVLKKGAAEKVTSVGFRAVIPLTVRAPAENNTKPHNADNGWYNRLFIDVVRVGSSITIGARFRSFFDGVTDNVKIVTVLLYQDGSMELMKDGTSDNLMRIKQTGSGPISFYFSHLKLNLRNDKGFADFYLKGPRVPGDVPNVMRESKEQKGTFEFDKVSPTTMALLRLQRVVAGTALVAGLGLNAVGMLRTESHALTYGSAALLALGAGSAIKCDKENTGAAVIFGLALGAAAILGDVLVAHLLRP